VSAPARTSALRAVPASPVAGTRHRPLPVPSVRLVGGPLAAWQQRNGEATIPNCIEQLEVSGVLDNFRRLLAESDAEFRGPVFADSDLYKVIEAVAWEIARTGTRAFDSWLDDVIALVARVQEPSGYVDTWIQGAVALVRAAVTAIPFSTWSNRAPGPMRVWLPRAPR